MISSEARGNINPHVSIFISHISLCLNCYLTCAKVADCRYVANGGTM
jgi:hypothetical protein